MELVKCKSCGVEYKPYRQNGECLCSEVCRSNYNKMIDDRNALATAKYAPIIDPVPRTNYAVDFQMHRLKKQFEDYANDYGSFDYNPDFQRGHVWNREKQIAFLEAICRNTIPASLLTITLNSPEFEHPNHKGDLRGFCIIDGLQRVTAVEEFVDGKFKIFDNQVGYDDLDHTPYSFKRVNFRVQVYSFIWRKDLLKYYIDINSGGVVHSDDEINRVKKLLVELG